MRDRPGIQITEEMIEAGAWALDEWIGLGRTDAEPMEAKRLAVRAIVSAMLDLESACLRT